jgi:pimeloyl-ACP methyl ester carboxylesterase
MTTISSGRINPIDSVRKQDSVSKKNVQDLLKTLLLVSVIVLAAVIAIRPLAVPPPRSTVGAGGFSVERALADLTMITAAPRVPGSSGYESAAAYLVAELEALGLDPQVTDAVSVHTGVQEANVGRARNIVARIPGTKSTGAVLLAGHLDSAHTALGASHAIPARPGLIATVFNLFQNDFVFWSMVKLSPAGLLVALGVPTEVQQQLSSAEVTELHTFLESIEPMGARRKGQLLEQQMSEYDAEQIQQIQTPTLVLHAPDDTLVAFEQGEFTAKSIPGTKLIRMESGGHLALMMNHNAAAKAQLADFLEQYNGR